MSCFHGRGDSSRGLTVPAGAQTTHLLPTKDKPLAYFGRKSFASLIPQWPPGWSRIEGAQTRSIAVCGRASAAWSIIWASRGRPVRISSTKQRHRPDASCGPGDASGWNCTAKIGLPRCRNPATVPSLRRRWCAARALLAVDHVAAGRFHAPYRSPGVCLPDSAPVYRPGAANTLPPPAGCSLPVLDRLRDMG